MECDGTDDPRFAPMLSIAEEVHVFLKDCVTFLHPQLGPTTGIIAKSIIKRYKYVFKQLQK